jgi:hypothetical protein
LGGAFVALLTRRGHVVEGAVAAGGEQLAEGAGAAGGAGAARGAVAAEGAVAAGGGHPTEVAR